MADSNYFGVSRKNNSDNSRNQIFKDILGKFLILSKLYVVDTH